MESKKQDKIKTELVDMEYREQTGGCQTGVAGSRGGGNWVKGCQRDKLPVIRQINPGTWYTAWRLHITLLPHISESSVIHCVHIYD